MLKKLAIFGTLLIIILLLVGTASAATMDEEVTLAPGDHESDLMLFIGEDYDVEITVKSNIPINVYIMESSSYSYSNPDFSKAVFTKKGVSDDTFSYTIQSDESHYLIIENPSSTQNATVSYGYDTSLDEEIEQALWAFTAVCLGVIVIIVVVIIVIIFFALRRRRRSPPPPPMPMQPQYGYQQPPPPPPPPQYGYQQPPPPPRY